jgi:DNA polymerase
MSVRGLEALENLFEDYADCTRCGLCEKRTQVVFGSGSVSANILVVGEAPIEEDEAHGVPFMGKSGRLFMDMLAMIWPDTEEMARLRNYDSEDNQGYFIDLREYLDRHIFWTSIVSCRPPEGRQPSNAEITACYDRLRGIIYAVDPMIIIALGKTAASTVVGKTVQVTDKRGTIFDVTVDSPVTGQPVRYAMAALLHPSFLLRKGDQSLVAEKKGETYKTLQDLKYILSLLDAEYKDAYGQAFPYRNEEAP